MCSRVASKLREKTGLVLSGGGARGAYEVGVLAGMVDVLRQGGHQGSPFGVYAGTSVGAIHAAYLASHAHRPDLGIGELTRVWEALDIREHMRPTFAGLIDALRKRGSKGRLGAHALDPSALERLVERNIDWPALHRNVGDGLVRAVLVAALDIGSGKTTLFGELAEGVDFRPTIAANRTFRQQRITLGHVLGSAAIPLVFPAREVGGRYYCDGGLRFNTPMSPAIRAGAERLVIVSLRAKPSPLGPSAALDVPSDVFLNPLFLAGKLLDALFLDPLGYDLHVLERFNRLLELLERSLDADALKEFERIQTETRGATYRRIHTLVFAPSQDIGIMAGRFLAETSARPLAERMRYSLLSRSVADQAHQEADLPSYVLFDGEFARQLIELGRKDAHDRANDILAFFCGEDASKDAAPIIQERRLAGGTTR